MILAMDGYVDLRPSTFVDPETERQRLSQMTAHELYQLTCIHQWEVSEEGGVLCTVCRMTATLAQVREMVEKSQTRAAREGMREAIDIEWRARPTPMSDGDGDNDVAARLDPMRMRNGTGPVTAVDLVGRQLSAYGHLVAQRLFIEAYRDKGTIRAGCMNAGVSRDTYKKWYREDGHFREQFDSAKEDYNDVLQSEIHRRAVDGVTKQHPVVYKGEIIDWWREQEYSDNLLMFQTKSRMPEYRDKVDPGEDKGGQIPWERIRDLWREEPAIPLEGAGQGVMGLSDDERVDLEETVVSGDIIEGTYEPTPQSRIADPWEEIRREIEAESGTSGA